MENSEIHNQQQEGDEEEQKHYSYAMQLALSSVLPMVLGSAVELQIFEIISKAGVGAQLSPTEIASQMPISDNPNAAAMLDRMLRLLASFSIFSCSLQEVDGGGVERRYGLAPVAKYFVRNQDGVSLGALMDLIQGKVFMDSWSELKGAVLEGGVAFDRVHGMHAFDYPGKDPIFNDVFNKAMINHTTIVMKRILETYKGFDGINQVVDVGGGLGVNLSLITSRFPHIKGINFDQPHVIENAPSYPGVEHVGGDMFASVPKGDAIFIKWILHDWSDEHCIKLLKNCHKALPDNGKVIVVEGVLPVLPETDPATKSNSQVDLVMMTQNPGGKERTQDEFLTLALGAGFTAIRNECFVCNFWVMEFLK